MKRTIARGTLTALAFCALQACGQEQQPAAPQDNSSAHEFIRERTRMGFQQTEFLKPRMDEDLGISAYMAPLIYRELPAEDSGAPAAASMGALMRSSSGKVELDTSQSVIYYSRRELQFEGRQHQQLAFQWYLQEGNTQIPRAQGVRLTLDSKGFPAIIELLADESGLRVIYVSENLEQAAQLAFGNALADRAFAIESDFDLNPEVVVARVFKGGPDPSGPMLYQPALGFDLCTLHCRCSPSQIDSIERTIEYLLLPFDSLAEEFDLKAGWTADLVASQAEQQLHLYEEADWLSQVLRLPDF